MKLPDPADNYADYPAPRQPSAPTMVFTPVKVTPISPGVTVYDLGQNAAIMPRLQVHGPAGASVRIIPAELLRPNGTVDRSSSGQAAQPVGNIPCAAICR